MANNDRFKLREQALKLDDLSFDLSEIGLCGLADQLLLRKQPS
jgi:hypothetical protein